MSGFIFKTSSTRYDIASLGCSPLAKTTSLKALAQDLTQFFALMIYLLLAFNAYQGLLLEVFLWLFCLKTLCAEEVKGLLQKKTLLNKMEDYQDYMAAFIDKILSTEGHCLLIHKKRVSNFYLLFCFLRNRIFFLESSLLCLMFVSLPLLHSC